MKLAVRDRFRLFFKGAVRELAQLALLKQEHRRYRDGMDHVVDALVHNAPPKPNTLYVMIESDLLLRIVRRVYGDDHPHAAKLVEFRRQFPGLDEPVVQVTN